MGVENLNDDEDLYPHADLDWMTIKSSDVNAVVNALELENIQQGSFGNFGDTANTFMFPTHNDWIIIIHQWEPRGSSAEYLNAMQQIVTELSQDFGEAQSFAAYEDVIFYTHWILARNGILIRSFAKASETDLFRNFGEVTETESFIDWTDAELFPRMPEVIRLSQTWSTEPIFSNYPGDVVGVLGYKHLQL
ncbi:hypothetical protein [Nostoc cycadae]|uniref:Uncharacterized protein n=1 Tax=Nostoc cycadae WK-1 TaxID=1861711 RepID=A0A2H6LH74_9NOSO|nr:hypothetical protein [Nostoc cycadae]GBE92533.1 hypothetical protein NCWK1_2289 [Nostoc cycadae WK-1]